MPILIGYDNTSYGQDALALGLQLAGQSGEPVTVATAFPDDERGLMVAMNDASWVRQVRQVAETKLESARELVGDHPNVTYETIGPASASRALHEYAERTKPHVLVMGSSERSAIGRITPGSTVERLLHGAPCPVAVAPQGYRRHVEPIHAIAVAHDGQAEAEAALDFAARVAARLGATLRVVGVAARADGTLESALQKAAGRIDPELSATSELLVDDDVVDTLADLPGPHPDVLVCGSRGYGPVRQILMGSVSTQVMRKAAYPVVIVPRSADAG